MNEHQTSTGATQEASDNRVAELVERAFQYRGDVTVRVNDGSAVTGYLFNRNASASEPFAQLFETQTGREVAVPYHSIAEVLFTGRDTAAVTDKRFEVLQHRREEQTQAFPRPSHTEAERHGN